jgi:hypothetical protein
MRFIRHEDVHRQRAEAEIDNADHDLQQRQRTAGKNDGPASAPDFAGLYPDPRHIDAQADQDGDRRRRD